MDRTIKMLADIEEAFLGEKEKNTEIQLGAINIFETSENPEINIENNIEVLDASENATEILKTLNIKKPGPPKSGVICIAAPDLSKDKAMFIKETVGWISVRLDKKIFFDQDNIEECTHLILETTSTRKCRKSSVYVTGVLLGKKMVSFSWYLDIFDNISTVSIETITLLNLIQGDIERSDVAELVYIYGVKKLGFFSGINLQGHLPEYIKKTVHALGGTTLKHSKRPSVQIDSDEMFYYMITGGSRTPWSRLFFPERF